MQQQPLIKYEISNKCKKKEEKKNKNHNKKKNYIKKYKAQMHFRRKMYPLV